MKTSLSNVSAMLSIDVTLDLTLCNKALFLIFLICCHCTCHVDNLDIHIVSAWYSSKTGATCANYIRTYIEGEEGRAMERKGGADKELQNGLGFAACK